MHLFINIYRIPSVFLQHAIFLIVKYLMRAANVFFTFSHNQTQQKELHVVLLSFALKETIKTSNPYLKDFRALFTLYFKLTK